MLHKSSFVRLLLFVPNLWFAAGCDPSFDAAREAATPSPTVAAAVNNDRQFTDSAAFEDSLLKALSARDLVKLQAWMTDPLVTSTDGAGENPQGNRFTGRTQGVGRFLTDRR